MKILDIVRVALSNFKVNKLRTLLTVCGVAIGIGAILFLVSLGYGLERLTKSRLLNLDALTTLTVTSRSTILKLDEETVKKLGEIPNVTAVSPLINLSAQLTLNNTTTNAVVYGIAVKNLKIEGIRSNLGKEMTENKEDSIISANTLKNLYGIKDYNSVLEKPLSVNVFIPDTNTAQVGGETNLRKETLNFKVTSVSTEENASGLFVNIETLKKLGVTTYNSLKVKVSDKDKINDVRKRIEEAGFSVTTVVDTLSQIDQIFQIIQIVLAGFGIIALFVASLGMLNTMTISLLERTHEIGIMKALGATNLDIQKLFLSEAALISTIGGGLGIVLAWLLGTLINLIVNVLANTAGGQSVSLFYTPPEFALGVLLFAFLVGLLTGVYPAKRAVKLSPLEALRYE
ncbi:MAG: ABC transporter permease [Patescibacteria group bacterium]|nr:ABC transporter permease [Patescibacteria group bacterium]